MDDFLSFWPSTIVFLIAFLIVVFFIMTRSREKQVKICLALLIFAIVVGFAYYSYGYLKPGSDDTNIVVAALRGIISTFKMFSLNDNFGELMRSEDAWLAGNIFLIALFWIAHICAAIVIQAALIGLFGRKLIDAFRLRFGSFNDIFIVKGEADTAFLLAANIATHDASLKHYDPSRLVVILPEGSDDVKNMHDKAASFGGIMLLPGKNRTIIYYMNSAGFGKPHRRGKKFNVVLMSTETSVGDEARLIAEYAIGKTDPDKLDVFVMTSSIFDREEIERIAQQKVNGRRKYPYTFHIVSEVGLFIRQMLDKHPPFECHSLSPNEKCMAADNFTVMMIGFGNVGQNALLRLIMSGQYEGSRMRAVVLDKKIDDIRDRFMFRHPALDLCCDIEFIGVNVHSDKFYNLLNDIDNVSYIVIALDTDESNKQTASDLRMHFERKGTTRHPNIAIIEKSGGRQSEYLSENIFCFGMKEDVYKESVIIREDADIMAKAVNEIYSGGSQPWYELDWFTQESNRASADFIPAMLRLAKLDADEAMEKDTLTEDKELAETLAKTEHLRWNAFHAAMGYDHMSIEEMNQRFENYTGSGDPLPYCRKDPTAKKHICLVAWEDLDDLSEAYRKLARRAGNEREQTRDFKVNDSEIIDNIPKFLRAAKTPQKLLK